MSPQQRLGIEQILSEVSGHDSNLSRYSVDGVVPKIVIEPADEIELARALRIANNHGLKVIVIGGGNDISLGNIPSGLDIVILTQSLARIVRYIPEDLTVSVKGGTTLEELQKTLSKNRQFLPIVHPGSNPTVGGIISCNSFTTGSMRDLLLGVRVANPGGTITKAGGTVVKNVAGYDLTKIYIGCLGSLGVILDANLKVVPLPDHETTIVILSNELRDLEKIVHQINSKFMPFDFKVVNANLLNSFRKKLIPSSDKFSYSLIVMHSGNSTSISKQSRRIERLVKMSSTRQLNFFLDHESRHLWSVFVASLGLNAVSRFRISIPRDQTFPTIRMIERELEYFKPKIFVNPGSGIVHTSVVMTEDPHLLIDRLKRLRKFVEEASGALVIESATPSLKKEFDVWGNLPAGFDIMRRIKTRFDPNNVLSPGRFIGGI